MNQATKSKKSIHSQDTIENINALSSVLKKQDYSCFSKFSMSPYGLLQLRNEIKSNKRKNIIEFGSGLSSILMARSILKHSPAGKIISIENDPYFCDDLNSYAFANNLHKIIKFIYAPLYPCPYLPQNKWYDIRILREQIDNQDKFDMAVIDGPPAWHNKIKLSRYGAIPFVFDRLAEEYSIFLDDANREGEKEILKMWEKQYTLKFEVLNNRIAITRGKMMI